MHVEKIKELIEECSPYERKELLSFIMHTTAPPLKFENETEDELEAGWKRRRLEEEKRVGFVEPNNPNLPPTEAMKEAWQKREDAAFLRGKTEDSNAKPTLKMMDIWRRRKERAEAES